MSVTVFLAKNSGSRTLAAPIFLVSCPAQLSGSLSRSACKTDFRHVFLAKDSGSRTLAASISLISCPAQLSGSLSRSACKRNLRLYLSRTKDCGSRTLAALVSTFSGIALTTAMKTARVERTAKDFIFDGAIVSLLFLFIRSLLSVYAQEVLP